MTDYLSFTIKQKSLGEPIDLCIPYFCNNCEIELVEFFLHKNTSIQETLIEVFIDDDVENLPERKDVNLLGTFMIKSQRTGTGMSITTCVKAMISVGFITRCDFYGSISIKIHTSQSNSHIYQIVFHSKLTL